MNHDSFASVSDYVFKVRS